jgi:hypothetical protein
MGLSARVATIPPGFSTRSILIAGQGLNDTLTALGNVLLAVAAKPRVTPTNNQVSGKSARKQLQCYSGQGAGTRGVSTSVCRL